MSNQTIKTISLTEATRKGLQQMLTHKLKVKGVSKLVKDALIEELEKRFVNGVQVEEDGGYVPVFNEIKPKEGAKKLKTTVEAFDTLTSLVGQNIVEEISGVMLGGVKLSEIISNPTKYFNMDIVPKLMEFAREYDVRFVKMPTRKMALVWVTELATAYPAVVNGQANVVVKPRLELRPQNAIIDTLAKNTVHIVRNEITGEIEVVEGRKIELYKQQGKKVQKVIDMRYIMSIDYNLSPPKGSSNLTTQQLFLQSRAIIEGVYFDYNGQLVKAEYFLSSASERRTVMGTHIVFKDAVEALHELGMDFRQFAKFKNGEYTLDMIKAPNRFGLASSSSIPSRLVKLGNELVEYENGEYAVVGGTHTMLCTDDVYSYVKTGKYLVFNPLTNDFDEVDARSRAFKRNVTDGMIFADASVQFTLFAEFGKQVSAEQVRITPATKGLVVFVPGLKEMCGHDLLAFESALKGNYRTLLKTNPDYKIEFRIAIAAHNAKEDKKKTNLPYQMNQTVFSHEHLDMLREKLDSELEEVFAVYDNPDKLADYLGTRSLDIYDEVTSDDLTDEQSEHIKGTLVSMFANFFYAGELVMEDPYFKRRLLDIIENMVKAWTRGSLPIDGHYRFCSTDVYGVMTSYLQGHKDLKEGNLTSDFIDKDGKTILVPSYIGIPAEHIVMVDDEDKYFLDGKYVILQRNPKISAKETAKAKTIVMKEYYEARKKYSFAFNNLIFYSCHDFLGIKQGGLDFDGDKSHASMDPVLLKAYKELPALLDVTVIDGEFIEGCPFPLKGTPEAKTRAEFDFEGRKKYRADVIIDGVPFNDEFTVHFTDADYNLDFARKCHELSKVFVLRSLEKNRIGELTDYATMILSAISRVEYMLLNNIDKNSNPLSEEERTRYKAEIERMEYQVDLLRLLQGWEIDKPKHGGAFWNALENQLKFITDPQLFPEFASITVKKGKSYTTQYAKLEWHRAAKAVRPLALQQGEVFPSLMQELRSHVLLGFATKIKARFNAMDPSQDTNNLIYHFAPHADIYDHAAVDAIIKLLMPIFEDYDKGQREIAEVRRRYEMQRDAMDFGNVKHEERKYDRQMKFDIQVLMDNLINNVQARVKALPFDEKTVAYIAYTKKYREYRPSKAVATAAGLSFPWVVCQDGMLELVALASGRKMNHIPFTDVQAAPVRIAFSAFLMAPERIKEMMEHSPYAGIVYERDEITGNYLPFLHVNKQPVAVLVNDCTYYFTGAERFVFTFKNVQLSATGKSLSCTMDQVVRYND